MLLDVSLRMVTHMRTQTVKPVPYYESARVKLYKGDCVEWLATRRANSFHAVVTDPPYGLVEFSRAELAKLRNGNGGGVWRLPPAFDGYERTPLPRFTTLTRRNLDDLGTFFVRWGEALMPKLVPGAHVLIASNPLLSFLVASAMDDVGFEKRGIIARLVPSWRGGDRPKDGHEDYPAVSVIPRSMWEPWLLFRKPLNGTIVEMLDAWGTGGLRRPDEDHPFGDVIRSAKPTPAERRAAAHPSLKPQAFLRQVVRAVLPTGRGTILDPFAGAGSTLAAAEALRVRAVGVEVSGAYCLMASRAIPRLAALPA